MNPFYGRPGEFDRVEAFKDMINMAYRWGAGVRMWLDTRDGDYHVFGWRVRVPPHFKQIAVVPQYGTCGIKVPVRVLLCEQSQ